MIYLAGGLGLLCVVLLALINHVVRERNWLRATVKWQDARESYFADLYRGASLICTQTPTLTRFQISPTLVYLDGTLLNHVTLLRLLAAAQPEEEARLAITKSLKGTLTALEIYERRFPVPKRGDFDPLHLEPSETYDHPENPRDHRGEAGASGQGGGQPLPADTGRPL